MILKGFYLQMGYFLVSLRRIGMSRLSQKKCIPCTKDTIPFTQAQTDTYLKLLDPAWQVVENHHLEKSYQFPDFKSALDFVNKVGAIAEGEGHHPDIFLAWGRVELKIWTHKIKGLSENDFILAAKVGL